MESNTKNISEYLIRIEGDIIKTSDREYLVRKDRSLMRLDKVRIKGMNRKNKKCKILEQEAAKGFSQYVNQKNNKESVNI